MLLKHNVRWNEFHQKQILFHFKHNDAAFGISEFYTSCLSNTSHQNKSTAEQNNGLLIYLCSNISSSPQFMPRSDTGYYESCCRSFMHKMTFDLHISRCYCLLFNSQNRALTHTENWQDFIAQQIVLFILHINKVGRVRGRYVVINHYYAHFLRVFELINGCVCFPIFFHLPVIKLF